MVRSWWPKHGTQAMEEVIQARTGQTLVADAPAPGVGWP